MLLFDIESAILCVVDPEYGLGSGILADDVLRDESLELRLNESLERTRTVYRIVARFCDIFLCGVADGESEAIVLKTMPERFKLQTAYRTDIAFGKRAVEYRLVDTVEKFGAEAAAEQGGDLALRVLAYRAVG